MADFFSRRVSKFVWLTSHAKASMLKRAISEDILIEIIERGATHHKDKNHLWCFRQIEGRLDNLICAAIFEADSLIVKTVMINWSLESEI
jgi:hypothetical protein